MILLTGVPAIWLSQSPSANARRYACLFGMAGQPFWLYAAISADQWGILIVNVLYTVAWGRGVWTHWLSKSPTA